ncbi:hypothetical protein HRbin21_01493 [bacterium HR21]|nr:hypothetical protein HRbin21_01493 [bacterium HR21]
MRMMTLVLGVFLLSVWAAQGAQEQQVPYSGVALSAAGEPVPDGLHRMEFCLFESGGTQPIWSEVHLVETRAGAYQVLLGSARPLRLAAGKQYWLEVFCDGHSLGRFAFPVVSSQEQKGVPGFRMAPIQDRTEAGKTAVMDGRGQLPVLGGVSPAMPLVVNTCAECTTTFWSLTGNAGTDPANNFLGTTDNQPLIIRTNNVNRVRITTGGQIEVLNSGQSVALGEAAGTAMDLTSPRQNTFVGYQAGSLTETGEKNVAVGATALSQNIDGTGNTALGSSTLTSVTSGNYNTAIGFGADVNGNLTNATAIGAYAFAASDNSVVIGSIAGVNGAPASANVGIGTTAPTHRLHVVSTADPLRIQGLQVDNTLDNALVIDPSGIVKIRSLAGLVGSTAWLLTGNTLSGGEVLGSLNAQPLVVVTNGTERLRVTATGGVGIGTNAPTAQVHIMSPSGGEVLKLQAVTGQSGSLLRWEDEFGNAWGVIDNSGLVGIGTATPVQKLHVVGNGAVSAVFVEGGVGVGTVNPLATLHVYDEGTLTPGTTQVLITAGASQVGSGVALLRWEDNGSNVLGVIDEVGQVGIGTAAPARRLHVVGPGGGISPVRLEQVPVAADDDVLTVNSGGDVRKRSLSGAISGMAWLLGGNTLTSEQALGTLSGHDLPIYTAGSERMRITTSGNVGIGTASPGERLDVAGNVRFSGALMPAGMPGAGGQVLVSQGAGTAPVWSNDMYWDQGTQRLGIGTATPTAKLDVRGGIYAQHPTGGDVLTLQAVVGQTGALLTWVDETGTPWGVIDNGGLVGIGTTTPVQKLHVVGNGAVSAVFVEGGVGVGTVNPLATLHVYDEGTLTPGTTQVLITAGASQVGSGVALLRWEDNGSNVLGVIDEVGQVGIGTAAPARRLHVEGDGTAPPARVTNLTTGAATDNVVVVDAAGDLKQIGAGALIGAHAWLLTGNGGTDPATNFLGTTDGQPLVIRTNNVERVRVTATGQVGIGTATPGALLHVAGDVRVDGNTTLGDAATDQVTFTARVNSAVIPAVDNAYDFGENLTPLRWRSGYFGTSVVVGSSVSLLGATNELAYSGGDGLIRVAGANALQVWTNGAERVRVTGGGVVQIQNQAGGTPTTELQVLAGNSGAGATRLLLRAGLGQSGTNLFEWQDATGTPLGVIDASGFVGIGTTTPQVPLHVKSTPFTATFEDGTVRIGTIGISGSTSGPDLVVWDEPGATQVVLQLGTSQAGANLLEWQDAVGTVFGGVDDAGNFFVNTNTTLGDAAADQVTITAGTVVAANIPGGSTATDVVVRAGGGALQYRDAGGLIGGYAWLLTGNSGTNPATNFLGTTDGQPLVIRTNNVERVRVTAAGQVGIGTPTPGATLDVAGTANVSGNTSVGGNLTVGGNTTLGDATSDNVTFTARVNSAVIPAVDNAYDFGENLTPLRWRSGYFGTSVVVGSSVSLLGATNELAYSGGDGLIRVAGANALQVWTNGAERVRVTAAGVVQVQNQAGGTPTTELQVLAGNSGAGATRVVIQAGNAQSGVNLLEWQDNTGQLIGVIDNSGFVGIGVNNAGFGGIAGYLHVYSNAAQPAAIFENGAVGIGTNAPDFASTLHIYDARPAGPGTGATRVVLQMGANQAGVNLLEWQDNTGQLIGVIDNSGFVGIGVNNAGFGGIAGYLHVYSNAAQPAAIFENGAVGIGTNAPDFASTLHIYDARPAGPGTGATRVVLQMGANQAGVNLLEWQDNTGQLIGVIDNSGFVGIGVNNAGFGGIAGYLHVYSNAAQPAAIFENGAVGIGTNAPDFASTLHIYDARPAGATRVILQAGAGQGTTNLLEWQNSSGTVLGVVDGAGRVGIGTNTPGAKLHVKETAPGVSPVRLGGVPAAAATDEVLRIDASGNVTKSSAAAVVSAGIIKGSFPITTSGSSFTISVAPADIQSGAIVTVTLVGPSSGTIYPLMVTNINAAADQITVESSAVIPGGSGYAIHYIIINP